MGVDIGAGDVEVVVVRATVSSGRRWQEGEMAIVRDNYGVIGAVATAALLKDRSVSSVQCCARRMNLKVWNGRRDFGRELVGKKYDDRALVEAMHMKVRVECHGRLVKLGIPPAGKD